MLSLLKRALVGWALVNASGVRGEEDGPPPEPPVEEEQKQPEEPPQAPPEPPVEEPTPVPEPVPEPPPPIEEPTPAAREMSLDDISVNVKQEPKESEKERNKRLLLEKVEKNQKLVNSGHVWQMGAWMYGDLAHGVIHEDHLTAHGCADHCEAQSECYHWVFYLDSGRCDMKTNGGSLYTDTDHMIVGHAKRYLEEQKNAKANAKAHGSDL